MPLRIQLFILITGLFFLLVTGCSSAATGAINPGRPKQQQTSGTNNSAEKFLEVHKLGKDITLNDEFDEFLGHLPKGKEKSRIYLVRIDDFPIGTAYSGLDKMDMALETGLIDGLLEKGLVVAEKLDHVNPRDFSEYIGTSPQDAFYMHGINLDDLKLIRNDLKAPNLLTYQIMDFSDTDPTVVVYLRMVDLKTMKVLTSGLVKVGDDVQLPAEKEINAFNVVHDVVKNINDFPKALFNKDNTVGLLNADILNISGNYKDAPSKKVMAIENGIVTGLVHNQSYSDNTPVILEKSKGFKLKYPAVYNSIVFNTSPILYEEWSEFLSETKSSILFMYRYIADYGLYLKVIDTQENGKILFSRAYVFTDETDKGIVENHDYVADAFKENVDLTKLKGKKILILDGDKQAVESQEYFNDQPTFNEMNLAIEEGMITALVDSKISVYEKLKTLYLKRPWMYDEKVFNLNPLYLDDWGQLKEFGAEALVVYNNLIPHEQMTSTSVDYKKIAIGVRIIDISTGDIVDVSELTNLNVQEEEPDMTTEEVEDEAGEKETDQEKESKE